MVWLINVKEGLIKNWYQKGALINEQLIVVHPRFDGVWPFAADHFHTLWQEQGDVEFIRLEPSDERNLSEIAANPLGSNGLPVLAYL